MPRRLLAALLLAGPWAGAQDVDPGRLPDRFPRRADDLAPPVPGTGGPRLDGASGEPRAVDPDEVYRRQLAMADGREQWDSPVEEDPLEGEDRLDEPQPPASSPPPGGGPSIPLLVGIWLAGGAAIGLAVRRG